MTEKKLQLAGAIALLVGISIGCAEDEGGLPYAGSIAFPAEAYLGGTVALAISSNYMPNVDVDSYDYHRDNIEVRVFYGEGDDDYVAAEPRSVFDISPARSSRAAIDAPGAFSTIVVFDLPTELKDYLTGCPCPGVLVKATRTGTGDGSGAIVTVLGPQDTEAGHGLPSFLGLGFDSDPSVAGNDGLRLVEEALQPQTMIRLRAVHDAGIPAPKRPGFGAVPGQEIGAIEFYVQYPYACMENLRVYPNSEAGGATAILGPPGGYLSWRYQKVVLVDPAGFTLDKPVGIIVQGDVAGEGPFLDLAFDWIDSPGCPYALESITDEVDYSGLLVTDLDGQVLIQQTDWANEFFTEHLVDLLPEE